MKRLYPILFFISLSCFCQVNTTSEQRRDSLIERGLDCYFKRDTLGLTEVNKDLKTLFLEQSDSLSLAKVYHFKALIFRIQFRLDSSYYYYHKSKDISIKIKDSMAVGRRLLSMANMQRVERDFLGSEVTTIEGLKYLEPLNENRFTGNLYTNLGLVAMNMGRYEESRQNFLKASKLYENNPNKRSKERVKLNILNNIGLSYFRENNYDKAEEYFKKGLDFDSIKYKYPEQYELILENRSYTFFKSGELKKAMTGYLEVLDSRKKRNNLFNQSDSHIIISEYYLEKKEYNKSEYHAKKALEIGYKTNNNRRILESLKTLSDLSTNEKAKQYFREYVKLNDSLNNRERYLKNQFAKVRYETEKKDKDNARLSLIKEQNEREIESQKQQKIIFSLAGALALVITITYFVNRRKKLLYEAQLQKASVREEERQQIAKSLHDEVAGDLRMLHQKLTKNQLETEAKSVDIIKENVRNLSHQLSSVSFDEVSFKDQIINLISDVFSLDFRVSTEGIDSIPWEQINNSIKRTIYICIRESLQNTLKYAEASKFSISFSSEKKEILVNLADNGKGFDEGKQKKGIGLKNLQERVEEIGGSFAVTSSPEGTETSIRIPHNGR